MSSGLKVRHSLAGPFGELFPTPASAPHPPPMGAREPARPRDCSRAVWLWLAETNRKIEDSWIGDLIGAICLFIMIGSFWILPLIYEVFK